MSSSSSDAAAGAPGASGSSSAAAPSGASTRVSSAPHSIAGTSRRFCTWCGAEQEKGEFERGCTKSPPFQFLTRRAAPSVGNALSGELPVTVESWRQRVAAVSGVDASGLFLFHSDSAVTLESDSDVANFIAAYRGQRLGRPPLLTLQSPQDAAARFAAGRYSHSRKHSRKSATSRHANHTSLTRIDEEAPLAHM